MSTYWRYFVFGYVFPIAWWLTAELYAVFANDVRFPTFTTVVTDHTSESVLLGFTAGFGIWLAVHWRQTFAARAKRLVAFVQRKPRA